MPDVLKLDFEDENVVSSLSIFVKLNFEDENVVSTLFNFVFHNTEIPGRPKEKTPLKFKHLMKSFNEN